MGRVGDYVTVVRTILKVVLVYDRHDGRLSFMLSVCWVADLSDAPYSDVIPFWMTDGISIGFRRIFIYISFLGGVHPK